MSPEARTQKSVVDWFNVAASGFGLDPRHLWHTANGGKRGKIEASILKGMGVRAGVPDLFLAVPKVTAESVEFRGGMFVEMKAAGGRIEASQREYIDLLKLAGYAVVVCWSFDEAVGAITRYLTNGDPLRK